NWDSQSLDARSAVWYKGGAGWCLPPYGQNIGHVIWPPGGLSQPLFIWSILDQNRNKLTSARAANAIITAGFPNACQNPCPTPDGSAHSLTPTPNGMKFTQASHK